MRHWRDLFKTSTFKASAARWPAFMQNVDISRIDSLDDTRPRSNTDFQKKPLTKSLMMLLHGFLSATNPLDTSYAPFHQSFSEKSSMQLQKAVEVMAMDQRRSNSIGHYYQSRRRALKKSRRRREWTRLKAFFNTHEDYRLSLTSLELPPIERRYCRSEITSTMSGCARGPVNYSMSTE